jgi:hypothetical protein
MATFTARLKQLWNHPAGPKTGKLYPNCVNERNLNLSSVFLGSYHEMGFGGCRLIRYEAPP